VGLLIFVLAWRLIPQDSPRSGSLLRTMDIVGIVLLGAGLLTGMLAATALADTSPDAGLWQFFLLLLLSALSLLAFVHHIRRRSDPFIQPRFIYGPDFG